MAILTEKHYGLVDNPNCKIGDDYTKVIIDDIDIIKLPSPLSKQRQLDNIEARQKVLRKMATDSVYNEKTRLEILERSKIPIKNDYVPPLKRLLQDRGIDMARPYRVYRSPTTQKYIFFQNVG